MTYNSTLLRLLDERGYIHQLTDAESLDKLAASQVVPGYVGFDATASSLHVGNLVSIMLLRRLQQAGHKPIVLMGGGTTRIGDPTGKDEVRKMLTDETIEANIASIRTAFERLLTFGDGPTDAVMVNNHDWLGSIGYIEMLQKIGTHFTVNRMLSFESVKLRLEREQPMTFLEFNYMILQGYDFRHLRQTMGVRLQMGGSDQWGNIINGVELARRMDGAEVFGLTTPLITKADGSKMGKSVSGAIWLNEDMLPNYDYWQFWRNCDDRDVGKFLRLFTDLPLEEVARLEALQGGEINEAKIVLANEATTLCRGEEAARAAAATAKVTFDGGGIGDDLPSITVSGEGIRVIAACTGLGLTASNGEAKRKIGEGAVRLDDDVVSDPNLLITVAPGASRKLSLGRKKHGVLRGT
ncbi:tyrosyl-tRNA synthetase [Novosphingobium chloroacetimidivorans]|uniref:Tyrosine--tRNA ligase n=1 Tax=Novosphingobium chloroacetimidivorans TaxID=1428314 RepID=A0A7W7K5V3_9SPHN|nr:tyrosine--tRNA ligase [Novosphingobium chloroacetimidivorans]MBB4856736.1 tyrosyl-tRNA synthetase [Novosphingobium chloroacetimidivorans]